VRSTVSKEVIHTGWLYAKYDENEKLVCVAEFW
jgi:hypothetical protein